ncbi:MULTISPECIES: VOC family protein [unclassified Paraflavitalea]|uniref:VOC family protein n=1 Tax=unclassified Paraflavitalea TaxID=2798305 RepID=UPI003D351CC3
MNQQLGQLALVVRDYNEAIEFYTTILGFEILEDTELSTTKRWVRVRPKGTVGAELLLAKAANEEQLSRVGNQTGGRVFLFLYTDDFDRDFDNYSSKGVVFVRPPEEQSYGKVAVFEDLYGNLWDLIQPK